MSSLFHVHVCAFVDRTVRFVNVSFLGTRKSTPVVKNSSTPQFPSSESTFEFPIYLSLADQRAFSLELVVLDKDLLKKEYLGEAVLRLPDWFPSGRAHSFDDLAAGDPISVPLVSSRDGKPASGIVTLKLGFETGAGDEDVGDVYNELLRRSKLSENDVDAPPVSDTMRLDVWISC